MLFIAETQRSQKVFWRTTKVLARRSCNQTRIDFPQRRKVRKGKMNLSNFASWRLGARTSEAGVLARQVLSGNICHDSQRCPCRQRPQIGGANVIVVKKPLTFSFADNFSSFKNVGALGQGQNSVNVLLHDE